MSVTTSSELGIRLTNFCESMEKEIVSRCIKVFRFEPHARRKLLCIRGEVTVTVVTPVTGYVEIQRTEDFKKPIHLLGLTKSCNSEKVAREVLSNCPFIDENSMLSSLIEAIEELKSRDYDQNGIVIQQQTAVDGTFFPRFPEIFDEFDMTEGKDSFEGDEEADFGKLSQYVEQLYESIPSKIEASMYLSKLAQCNRYLRHIAEHDSAINALFRTLREDSKKSSQLSKNILTICMAFAKFRDFHGILIKHKMPLLTLDIIDYELERCEKWKTQLIEIEANTSKNKSVSARALNDCQLRWLRLEELTSFQNSLLTVAFQILNCLSEETSVREILLRNNLISSLSDALERRDNQLLEVVVSLLKNLSCYQQCLPQIIAANVVDKLAVLLKEGSPIPKKVIGFALQLFYNISFNSLLRQKIVDVGLIPIIVNCFDKAVFHEITSKLLYILSMEPQYRVKLAKTSVVGTLMNHITLEGNAAGPAGEGSLNMISTVAFSLAVNISRTKRGAKLIWETNLLGSLIKRSLIHQDFLGMKIIRNLAEQNVAFILYEYLDEIAATMVSSDSQEFVTECIGTLACFDMQKVDVEIITQKGRIYPWLNLVFGQYLEMITKNIVELNFDLRHAAVDVLLLLGNVCSVEDGARSVVGEGLLEIALKILSVEFKKASEIVDCIFIFLKKCTEHESISIYLALKTRLPTGLLELAESSTGKCRQNCIEILEQIGKFDENWKENIQQFHFLTWNKEWAEAILDGAEESDDEVEISKSRSQESTCSKSRDVTSVLSSTGSEDEDLWSSDNGSDPSIFGMFRQQFEEEMGRNRREQWNENVSSEVSSEHESETCDWEY